MRSLRKFALTLAALGAVAGCGGDDEQPSGDTQQQSQEQRTAQDPDAQIAQRLESYLETNVKAKGSVTEDLTIVDDVQVTRGQAKVYALLNAEIPADKKPARKVCRAVEAAKVPGVESAVVVDAGDAEILRC